MKKFLKKLHLILALPTGLIISIICFTGALMSMDEYIRPHWDKWPGIYRSIMFLHRWLLDPSRAIGKLVVGVCTIFFIVLLLSGLFIWLPRKWSQLQANLRIKTKGGLTRRLFDLHRVLGVYALLMLLLLSLTGLMWSFEGYRETVFSLVQVDRVPDRVAIANKRNRETGEMVRIDFNQRENSAKVMRWAYLLHTGKWGGWFGPLLTGTVALIGASLPITGYVLYFRRIRRRRKS